MDNKVIQDLVDAINRGDEEYLLEHKQDLIDNTNTAPGISLSALPASLRGDMDVMIAQIAKKGNIGGVYEMNDLAYVYSKATDELKQNPEFINIVKEFESFIKKQSEIFEKNYKEFGNPKAYEIYYKALEDKKESFYNDYVNNKLNR